MIQQLLIIAAIIGIWLFIRWVRKQPKQKQFQPIAILVAIILIGLAATGRLHWLFALFAAIVPVFQRVLGLISYVPLLGRLFTQFRNTQSSPNMNQHSSVETEYLSMTLDHSTGVMSGKVRKGTHIGKKLEDLSITELIELYKEISQFDSDSAQLLETYLDRTHKDAWREHIEEELHTNHQASQDTMMTTDEAYNILGLNNNASREDIIEAHRRLIQKLHPDRGGNDYLATKINQAKDFLLKEAA